MATEQMTKPIPEQPPMPGQAEGQDQMGMVDPMQLMGGKPPTTRKIESQLYGMEQKRARSDDANSVMLKGIEDLRETVLNEFQALLEENGVDINDPESIKAFIDELGKINPDYVVLLETIFRSAQPKDRGIDFSPLAKQRDLKKSFNEVKGMMGEDNEPEETQAGTESPEEEVPENEQG